MLGSGKDREPPIIAYDYCNAERNVMPGHFPDSCNSNTSSAMRLRTASAAGLTGRVFDQHKLTGRRQDCIRVARMRDFELCRQ
ncbi:hypothetical protein [Burkholderia ubonensis]|uniref:hypothetical protein n=1 Tax=Burkholderia ubonensis TaxID=101571 RepID=UPI000AD62EAC|nr:hypothetical protein [Burkholderia ubonensis]